MSGDAWKEGGIDATGKDYCCLDFLSPLEVKYSDVSNFFDS